MCEDGSVIVSAGEAVVLLNVEVRPDDRALREWKERVEHTRERLRDLPDTQLTQTGTAHREAL